MVSDRTMTAVWASAERDVVVLRWPEQADELPRLAAHDIPRLLLVAPGAEAPDSESCLEDWLRLPAEDADVRARLRALARRCASHPVRPAIDEFGQLTFRGRALFLSPAEERLARALVEHFGTVTDDAVLKQAVRADGASTEVLRVHMSRLRRRIAPLGLTVTCVRGSGYALHEESQPRLGLGSA